MGEKFQLDNFQSKLNIARDTIELCLNDTQGRSMIVEFPRAASGRVTLELNRQLTALDDPSKAVVHSVQVLDITELGGGIAQDGSPILEIKTKTNPRLGFRATFEQVEAVEAWLGKIRMASKHQKDH